MVGWIILAVLAILILLVFFLPYGVDVGYADEVLRVGIKAGPLRIWLLPKKPLTEKQRLKAEAKKAKKEARRAERRAANPDGIANPNTSRRKVRKQQKAAESTEFAGMGKLTEEQKEDIRQKALEKEQAKGGLSGDPNRPYCRGRAYDPSRYGKKNASQQQIAAQEPQEDSLQSADSDDSQ